MALGAGLAVSNTRAVFEGLFSRDLTFERTPKQGWRRTQHQDKAYRVNGSFIAMSELLLVAYIMAWKVCGTGMRVWTDLPFVLFFGYGLLAMALPSFKRLRRFNLSG
jgi:hypothetical protein